MKDIIEFVKKYSVAIGLASLVLVAYITNLSRGVQLFIGMVLLSFGCFLDFDWYGPGTCLRFLCGLMGAYYILGKLEHNVGGVIAMIWGFIGYSWAIRSGSLSVLDVFYIEGFPKYGMRIACAFFFNLGLRDVKD